MGAFIMIKKYLLLFLGLSIMAFTAQANFQSDLDKIKNGNSSVKEKLEEIYALADNVYQNLDDSGMDAEKIGLELSTKAAKAAATAREIAENNTDADVKEELSRVTEYMEFIGCYASGIGVLRNLQNALENNDKAAVNNMLGKTVMCRKISGVARVKSANGTMLELENIAGKTSDTYDWGEPLAAGSHIVFGDNNQTPVSI
jgi:TPR repeat protein